MDWIFVRFKGLSAYSQEHVEIMDQREGTELFFGMSSNPNYGITGNASGPSQKRP